MIPSHSTTEEAEHNFYINSTYKDSLDANATKNLMIVRANANSSEDSSLNAGPIYGATDVSVEPNSNVTRELDAIREKDRILSQKDAAWLKQMYESGIITNEGTGAKGGGTLPPGAGIDTPPTQNPEGVPNTPFTIDLGPIIIYFSGTWANIVTKSDKPSKQYGPDGITACFPSWSRVMVPNGETEISNLKNGDEVYTYSIDGNLEKSKIISTERHEEKNYTVKRYQLNNGKVLDVTDNHVVLTSSGVYKKLSDLSENDYLVYFDGSSVRIESVELLGEYPVYNIKVDKNESYIVNGIVVHDR